MRGGDVGGSGVWRRRRAKGDDDTLNGLQDRACNFGKQGKGFGNGREVGDVVDGEAYVIAARAEKGTVRGREEGVQIGQKRIHRKIFISGS